MVQKQLTTSDAILPAHKEELSELVKSLINLEDAAFFVENPDICKFKYQCYDYSKVIA